MSTIVTTAASRYVIDTDACTLRRTPVAEHASSLRKDGETVPLIEVLHLHVGEPAQFLIDVRGDGIHTIRYTTEVRSIEQEDTK